jgi:hypothetical protein
MSAIPYGKYKGIEVSKIAMEDFGWILWTLQNRPHPNVDCILETLPKMCEHYEKAARAQLPSFDPGNYGLFKDAVAEGIHIFTDNQKNAWFMNANSVQPLKVKTNKLLRDTLNNAGHGKAWKITGSIERKSSYYLMRAPSAAPLLIQKLEDLFA